MLLMLLQGDQQLDCALDLMRRLPPQQIEKNLGDLIDLVPSLCEDLLSSVDQPLKIAKDKQTGKDYLLCDYNRDGDSYRLVMGGDCASTTAHYSQTRIKIHPLFLDKRIAYM